ncbi:MAG: tripartite tricarboxylate transporter TctB family protein [Rhodobacteraceae bacterium]|nr:tripartite tricarboxylate transporter TctB family protein [Paracoccaceae bacterium]
MTAAPRGRRPDRAALAIAAGLAALAGVVFWQTSQMPVSGQYARVGPTTVPYVVAAGLAALAVGTAVSAWRGGFPEREADNLGPMVWIVGGLIAQMLLLKTAGFSIATGALFAMTARGFGRGPLWLTLPVGVVFAFAVYVVFALGLQLSLPAGPLERLLP